MSLFVNLKNCHGIVKLESSLQFKNNTILIYASNGIMKTSFSKTIKEQEPRFSQRNLSWT